MAEQNANPFTPALTAEEWTKSKAQLEAPDQFVTFDPHSIAVEIEQGSQLVTLETDSRPEAVIAALNHVLVPKRRKLTWAHVDALRHCVDDHVGDGDPVLFKRASQLANIIASYLPPREA